MQSVNNLEHQATKDIANAQDRASLEAIRIHYLGKKGKLTEIVKSLASLPIEDRPRAGKLINETKKNIISLVEEKKQILKNILLQEKVEAENIDITLVGRNNHTGSYHPVTQIKIFVNDYFSRLGFDVVKGPEVETPFYNFEALNIPKHHPARAMHDTFYFDENLLLRTHTSPVQIRRLEKNEPPLRLIAPGRVYRCDSDITHTPMFHQVEGLCVDKQATLKHLRGLLTNFFNDFFKKKLALRFRPSYFPFTEPSAEVDIQCTHCEGKGCRSCKYTGWLEVLGCGMIHPNVLDMAGISSSTYQGWAFGIGLDRLAMLYFGIDDLRMLFENEVAFLKQF
ncbi:MAG: phenylalanine--tRNA ligase subunit alpha [Legionellaceae bacterium]|nr:phenylalanine--tRNA ligase subunit alpha [Legionellaceae bacterium]